MENSSNGPYYYINSIVKPNSVVGVFTAYLMQSAQFTTKKKYRKPNIFSKQNADIEMKPDDSNFQQELKTEIRPYNEKGYTQNLVIVKNNSVEVYIIDGDDFYPYHTFEI